jgi:hypothetical protein
MRVLLFPDGRLLSRRWLIVAWAAVLGATLAALADGFYPGRLLAHEYIENPLGAAGPIGQQLTAYGSLAASKLLASALLLVSTLATLFSPVVRLRRARGDERQQLKWFLYAAVPAAVVQRAARGSRWSSIRLTTRATPTGSIRRAKAARTNTASRAGTPAPTAAYAGP